MIESLSWFYFIFLLLFLISLLPAIYELLKKKDANPIPINLEFTRDPAFFGKSFFQILTDGLYKALKVQNLERLPFAHFFVRLSRNEELILAVPANYIESLEEELKEVVIITGNTVIDKSINFLREVVVLGNLTINAPCSFRTLLVKGDVVFNTPVSIIRWLHVEGELYVNSASDLGINAYIRDRALFKSSVRFKRIFAQKIESTEIELFKYLNNKEMVNMNGSLKVVGSLKIGGQERAVTIEGDVFSDDDIEMEGDVWVKGNIFTQKRITLKKGVVVGSNDKTKSVVAKNGAFLEDDFRIYGYLHTEGEGIIKL